jgi:hypothetical protein
MSRVKVFFLTLLLAWDLNSIELMKDYLDYSDERTLPKIANDFVYGEGSTQITSHINEYQNIVANKPIQGSIFVTHDANNIIDVNSFRLGNKPLKVAFVQTSQMSSSSNIVVTIYSFQLEGLPVGTHTLPSINVKVAGKEVRALPLVIEISN